MIKRAILIFVHTFDIADFFLSADFETSVAIVYVFLNFDGKGKKKGENRVTDFELMCGRPFER